MKEIAILLEKEILEPYYQIQPYYDVLLYIQRVSDGIGHYSTIPTYCLDFFSFEYLDMGWDVVMYKNDNKTYEMYEVIRLSELLDPEKRKQYTDKEIRKSHNVLKMFKAGAFKLKGE
jgi:hypothetical protein